VTPDLVVLGNLLVDDIVFPDGRTRMGEAGGAAFHTALAARLWGVSVGVASVAGDDYPIAALDALAERGVDLTGVRRLDGPGVRTWLLYEAEGRRVVHRRGCPSHEDVSPRPADLPADYLGARAYHLAPMPLATQRALVDTLAPRAGSAIALDPHEPITPATLGVWRPVLAHVDALFASEDELELPGVTEEPRAVLRGLAGGRLRFVAYKRGRRGGVLHDARQGAAVEWPGVPRLTGDPTGAGDAFAGGFLAGILSGATLETAIEQAIVSTSFALEAPGAAGLLSATRDEAERRRREWLGSGTGR
jgi:sugar/nucleoside kinase (ribokinase family)